MVRTPDVHRLDLERELLDDAEDAIGRMALHPGPLGGAGAPPRSHAHSLECSRRTEATHKRCAVFARPERQQLSFAQPRPPARLPAMIIPVRCFTCGKVAWPFITWGIGRLSLSRRRSSATSGKSTSVCSRRTTPKGACPSLSYSHRTHPATSLFRVNYGASRHV